MSPNAIKRFQQEMKRVCPLVILERDNHEASELVMLGLSEGLRYLTPLFVRDSLRYYRSEERLAIYRRMIRALASDVVSRWRDTQIARARKNAEIKGRARSHSPARSMPVRRNPRPPRPRRR